MTDVRVLVVDDEANQREALGGFLLKRGYDTVLAADGDTALRIVHDSVVDVMLTDVRMPGMDGAELLAKAKVANPLLEVIVITAFGAIADAVEAMRHGAAGYMTKPIDLDELEMQIQRAVERRNLVSEVRELRRQVAAPHTFAGIVAESPGMTEALDLASRAAATDATVLIRGESGTGKELVARAVHHASARRDGPFVAVNCAAFAATLLESELFGHEKGAFTGADRQRAGRFEMAGGGTLFLDEIGDMPQSLQVKLLRVLQERTFERVGGDRTLAADARIVAATHRDLEQMVADGSFRQDLYYRLDVVNIRLPALRERRADIPALIEHFRHKAASQYGKSVDSISREAMDLLVKHDYPGNVRELENLVTRMIVLARGPVATLVDLPGGTGDQDKRRLDDFRGDLPRFVEEIEMRVVREALDAAEGNQSQAARAVGLSERNLRYKLQKWGW
ncbi:MAG: sigma-54-dependent Fis family transcriptional regulator [bacterium]|nr:sigma-54-dependent Fis family transcriptional regulator [bacterium]